MDPVDTLIGLSEVSLALGGFAAIVLVLGTRANALDDDTLAYVRLIVSNAVGSAFACLIGVAILALEVSPPFVWVLLSAIVLTATVVVSALNFFLFLRHLEARASGLAFFWWSFPAVGCVVHLANALGLLAPPSFGLFFFGLVIVLGQAGLQFVFLVYSLLKQPAA